MELKNVRELRRKPLPNKNQRRLHVLSNPRRNIAQWLMAHGSIYPPDVKSQPELYGKKINDICDPLNSEPVSVYNISIFKRIFKPTCSS